MNIYLDESYNLQKNKGKMFISINGFAVLNAKRLRKRWKHVRKPYTKYKRRIHATDPYFESLRPKSMSLMKIHDISVASVFQLVQELPYEYFDKQGVQFERVYSELLKRLFKELSLQEYKQVRIIIDSRKYPGCTLGANQFQKEIEQFLKKEFSSTKSTFLPTPSYVDVLVELADFVSNTFYRAYQTDDQTIFDQLGYKLIQIKNPL
ncbi:MAG: DUF3800 domain-containing protein [Candidatus Magasanikbacteria bacterium]|nr:DUF3800 domain-containing protein [Candidatus Magasanikbacteria bacterium]